MSAASKMTDRSFGTTFVMLASDDPTISHEPMVSHMATPRRRTIAFFSSTLFGEETPGTVEEKKSLALRHGVAMWDTIGSCEIVGSSDASITNVVPNDLRVILDAADIRAIFCNGGASYESYNQYCRAMTGREAVRLPSTSPANARWTKEMLLHAWREAICPYLTIV